MQSRFRRMALTFVSVAMGGYLMATGGCLSFFGERGLQIVDFCFVIDCTDGLSGVLQPCNPDDPERNLFVDCPDEAP